MPSTQTHSRFGNLISLQYLYTRRLLFFTCIRVHVFGVCFRLCLCLCCCCMIYIKTLSKSMNLIQQSAHMYSMQIYTLVFAIAFGSSFSTGCCRSHTLNQSLFSSNIHRTKLFLGKCVNKRKNKPDRILENLVELSLSLFLHFTMCDQFNLQYNIFYKSHFEHVHTLQLLYVHYT